MKKTKGITTYLLKLKLILWKKLLRRDFLTTLDRRPVAGSSGTSKSTALDMFFNMLQWWKSNSTALSRSTGRFSHRVCNGECVFCLFLGDVFSRRDQHATIIYSLQSFIAYIQKSKSHLDYALPLFSASKKSHRKGNQVVDEPLLAVLVLVQHLWGVQR